MVAPMHKAARTLAAAAALAAAGVFLVACGGVAYHARQEGQQVSSLAQQSLVEWGDSPKKVEVSGEMYKCLFESDMWNELCRTCCKTLYIAPGAEEDLPMNFEISGREPPADTGLPYGVRFGDFVGNGNSIVFNGANAGDCPNFSCQVMPGIAFLPLLLPLPSPARPVSEITLPLSISQRQWPSSTGTLGGLCSPSRPPKGSHTSTRGSEPMSTATRIRRRGGCTRSSRR